VAKNVPPHLRAKAAKCIFCGQPGLTRTHIWPDWLNKMFPGKRKTRVVITHSELAPISRSAPRQRKNTEGNLFSLKPYLACGKCNGGWMKKFEDDSLKFIKPILLGHSGVRLSNSQIITLAGWLCLIIILFEFVTGGPVCIPASERIYLKRHRQPSDSWAIFVAGLYGPEWSRAASHFGHRIFTSGQSTEAGLAVEQPFGAPNSQITSLGMGKLFVHAINMPNWRWLRDFEVAARARGLTRIWPRPLVIWPFTKGQTKFPPKLTLTDEAAYWVAESYANRLDAFRDRGAVPKK
jgi:hypothetical protein